jgi:hypothetical protein
MTKITIVYFYCIGFIEVKLGLNNWAQLKAF